MRMGTITMPVKLFNKNAAQPIYVCEATAEDVNYSVNADFSKQVLPVARELRKTQPDLMGVSLLNECLAQLMRNHDKRLATCTDKKSVAYGIPGRGKGILGSALRQVLEVVDAWRERTFVDIFAF